MSETYFIPYEGKAPYIFVSYAHDNSDIVLPAIKKLHDAHYRIWYDEGIPAGVAWSDNIAFHLSHAMLVLIFKSETACNSINCANEAAYALTHKQKVLVVNLDHCPMDGSKWDNYAKALQQEQYIDYLVDLPDLFYSEIQAHLNNRLIGDGKTGYERPLVKDYTDSNKGKWKLLIAAAIFVTIAAICLPRFLFPTTPQITPDLSSALIVEMTATDVIQPKSSATPRPTIPVIPGSKTSSFSSQNMNTAIRNALVLAADEVIYESRLKEIDRLVLCGDQSTSDRSVIRKDDYYYLNNVRVSKGDIQNLSEFAHLTELQELTLCWQQIRIIDGVEKFSHLKYLDLSGNPLEKINKIAELPRLEVLDISNTKVRDLSVLNSCPSLKQVLISTDMIPLVLTPETQDFEIIITRK